MHDPTMAQIDEPQPLSLRLPAILARFRTSEWIFLTYFAYVALLAIAFRLEARIVLSAFAVLFCAVAIFALFVVRSLHRIRDIAPILLVLACYREMDWFSSTTKTRALETQWLRWDHEWLFDHGFREAIECLGRVFPGVLEFSYLWVYGIAALSVGAFYLYKQEIRVGRFFTVYLISTLSAYAMFPFFPSDPPRVVFAGLDLPNVVTPLRQLNLFLVSDYGIHSSVFPSAHVSSAFGAAWGLIRFLPERRAIGWGMLVYAVVVSIATVYGRYHYAVDALAGFGVSLIALAVAWRMRPE